MVQSSSFHMKESNMDTETPLFQESRTLRGSSRIMKLFTARTIYFARLGIGRHGQMFSVAGLDEIAAYPFARCNGAF
jgi:hypothetical protein